MLGDDKSNKFWFRNDSTLPHGYQRCFECYGIFFNEYRPPVVERPIFTEVQDYFGERPSGSRRAPSEWELQKRAEREEIRRKEEVKRQKEIERFERAEERAYQTLAEGFKYRPKRCKCGNSTRTRSTFDDSVTESQVVQPTANEPETPGGGNVVTTGDNNIVNFGDIAINEPVRTSTTTSQEPVHNQGDQGKVKVTKGQVTVTVNGVTIRNPGSSVVVEKKGNTSVNRSDRTRSTTTVAEQLQQISDLYFAGALTAEQFETAKNQILGL